MKNVFSLIISVIMGRYSSSRPCYNGISHLDVGQFTEQGIFNYPDTIKKGVIPFGSYQIPFYIRFGRTLVFDYLLDGEKCTYIFIVQERESNLPNNKGKYHYLICPFTRKKCLRLYFYDGKFMHRSAINGFYRSQTTSHQERAFEAVLGKPMELDNLYEELYKPYRKRHYRGKPTPLARKIAKIESKLPSLQEQAILESSLFSN